MLSFDQISMLVFVVECDVPVYRSTVFNSQYRHYGSWQPEAEQQQFERHLLLPHSQLSREVILVTLQSHPDTDNLIGDLNRTLTARNQF